MRAIIAKVNNPEEAKQNPKNANLTYLKSMMGYRRDELLIFDNLEPGDYIFYVEFDWHKD